MTFEVSCPAEESAWALEQMRQTVFSGRLDPLQLESEKRVIGEEILQLRDDPAYLGRLLVMERLFAGHPYGRPVFGDGSAIRAATIEQLQAFCAPRLVAEPLRPVGHRRFHPGRRWRPRCARNWGALARGYGAGGGRPRGRAPGEEQRAADRAGRPARCHLFFGWRAPEFNDEQRLPFSLLTHILGSGLNPLLGGVLRGGRQQVERVDMSYLPMRSGGMALLHVILKPKDIRGARNEVSAFLSRIGSFNFSKEDVLPRERMYVLDYLESARNQMEYGDANFRESTLNLSLACARFLLLNRTPVKRLLPGQRGQGELERPAPRGRQIPQRQEVGAAGHLAPPRERAMKTAAAFLLVLLLAFPPAALMGGDEASWRLGREPRGVHPGKRLERDPAAGRGRAHHRGATACPRRRPRRSPRARRPFLSYRPPEPGDHGASPRSSS